MCACARFAVEACSCLSPVSEAGWWLASCWWFVGPSRMCVRARFLPDADPRSVCRGREHLVRLSGRPAGFEPPTSRVGTPGFGLRAPRSCFSSGQSVSGTTRERPSRPAVLLALSKAGPACGSLSGPCRAEGQAASPALRHCLPVPVTSPLSQMTLPGR